MFHWKIIKIERYDSRDSYQEVLELHELSR